MVQVLTVTERQGDQEVEELASCNINEPDQVVCAKLIPDTFWYDDEDDESSVAAYLVYNHATQVALHDLFLSKPSTGASLGQRILHSIKYDNGDHDSNAEL